VFSKWGGGLRGGGREGAGEGGDESEGRGGAGDLLVPKGERTLLVRAEQGVPKAGETGGEGREEKRGTNKRDYSEGRGTKGISAAITQEGERKQTWKRIGGEGERGCGLGRL